jgi:hypothetical protein
MVVMVMAESCACRYGHARMYWNITDVRDIAETQRLIGESTVRVGPRILGICSQTSNSTKL